MPLQRRSDPPPSDGAGVSGPAAGDWGKWYPLLVEFLSRTAWEDGKKRDTGTVMLMFEGGRWKAYVNDRDRSESCFVTGPSPDGLLSVIEELLATGGGDWRPSRVSGSGSRGSRR